MSAGRANNIKDQQKTKRIAFRISVHQVKAILKKSVKNVLMDKVQTHKIQNVMIANQMYILDVTNALKIIRNVIQEIN